MAAQRAVALAAMLHAGVVFLVPAQTMDCDPDVNYSDPFNSCICRHWEKFYEKMYPDVDYSACERLADDTEIGNEFLEWIKKYRKQYPDRMEKRKRYATFAANFVYLKFQNQTTNDYECEVNEFADLSPEEFHTQYLGLKLGLSQGPSLGDYKPASSQQIADEWDWVAKGAVNPPMNQGDANSCWAFTAASAVEGGWAAKTGVLVQISRQQFVDCTGNGNDAVRGGDLESPIRYVAESHHLCSERSYPYKESDGECVQQAECTIKIPRGAVVGFQRVQRYDEEALMQALYLRGPVGVGIDGMGKEVMFYKSGVLTAPCSANLNHAVTAVGYGRQGHLPYWKVKNSWGTNWGENGFFRLIRGLDGAGGCGIKSIPTVPVITDNQSILGMADNISSSDTHVSEANERSDTWDELWTDIMRKWQEGSITYTGMAFLGTVCLCTGMVCSCCSQCSKCSRKSRGGENLLDEDEDDLENDSGEDEDDE